MARPFPSRADAIFAFDVRHEFLQKEIAVAERIAGRVDVETALAFRRHHQKVADLMLAAQVFDYAPSAGAEQRLLVLAKTVEKVEHGIAPRRRFLGVIVRRQLHTVVDRLLENAAVDDVAVGTALRVCQPGRRMRIERTAAKSKREVICGVLLASKA